MSVRRFVQATHRLGRRAMGEVQMVMPASREREGSCTGALPHHCPAQPHLSHHCPVKPHLSHHRPISSTPCPLVGDEGWRALRGHSRPSHAVHIVALSLHHEGCLRACQWLPVGARNTTEGHGQSAAVAEQQHMDRVQQLAEILAIRDIALSLHHERCLRACQWPPVGARECRGQVHGCNAWWITHHHW